MNYKVLFQYSKNFGKIILIIKSRVPKSFFYSSAKIFIREPKTRTPNNDYIISRTYNILRRQNLFCIYKNLIYAVIGLIHMLVLVLPKATCAPNNSTHTNMMPIYALINMLTLLIICQIILCPLLESKLETFK